MTINNRGLSGQPILPYVDYRSYMGSDVFIDLTFLDHTGTPVNPTQVTYRIDDLTNAVPMVASTSLTNTKCSGTGSIGFVGTGTVTGDVLSVATAFSGILSPTDVLSITGLPIGTKVLSQISGTTGGVGTYRIDHSVVNPISLGAVVSASTILYITSVSYGVFAVGDQVVNPFWTSTIQALATNPNPATLTGTLWLLQATPQGPFSGNISVASSLPSSYTLQIPGSQLQMTHNWQGSQICQIWFTSIWTDPVTNQTATAQGVSVIELCAVQTPNGAL